MKTVTVHMPGTCVHGKTGVIVEKKMVPIKLRAKKRMAVYTIKIEGSDWERLYLTSKEFQ